MARSAALLALALLLTGVSQAARSQVAYRHQGANNPINEGWGVTPGDTGAGIAETALNPDPVGGLDAWAIDDTSTASSTRLRYEVPLSAIQLGDSDVRGWTLRLILRVVEPAGAAVDAVDASIITEVSEGPGDRRYALIFGTDPAGDGDPVVSVFGGPSSVSSGPSSYTLEGVGDTYQEYRMTVDPVTGLATVWVGGVPRISSYAGVDAGTVAPRLNWGSGQSNSTGRAHYHLVEWGLNLDRDSDGIPDSVDNCPSIQNNPASDVAGVGDGSAPDGVGDACQCGDLGEDGTAGSADLARYRAFLADPDGAPLTSVESTRCGAFGDPFRCSLVEVVALARAIEGLPPGIAQSCFAAQPRQSSCGDGVCSQEIENCRSCAQDCGRCLIGQACVLPEECASGTCVDGVCAAVPVVPGEPRCGDGICNGRETCSHVGLHGCYDDCGPCAEGEYCLETSDCGQGFCESAGRCTETGGACWGECPGNPDTDACHSAGWGFPVETGLCSDLATQCETNGLLEFFDIHKQDSCDAGDYCRPRFVCRPPREIGCGAPPVFARRCDNYEACKANDDCKSGVCYDQPKGTDMCTPPIPDGYPCSESNDCQGVCNVFFCESDPLPDGSLCSVNSACESGICNGLCAPGPLPNGTPCLNSTACASGLCLNGICSQNDCGDGICDGPFESCHTPDPRLVPPFGVRCQEDCGKCEDGSVCFDDSDCKSDACDPLLRGCLSCRFLNNGSCADGEQCDADGDCSSGNCVGEQTQPYGYCAPVPAPCSEPTGRPNGCGCSSNGQCASNDCVGYDGSNWCVPNNCTAPGESCSSNSQCCDFPGYNLSCYDFNPLPILEDKRCALSAP